MKTYNVDFPVLLRVCTQVEAESEDEAIKKALDNYDSNDRNYFVEECSALRRLVQGNVFYGCIREAAAEEDTVKKKQLTTGQRLAYMLRTAVIEAQAVERGVYPKVTLDMSDFGSERRDGMCEVCLAGVYALLGRGLRTPWGPGDGAQRRDLLDYEYALDSLRLGSVNQAARDLGLPDLRPDQAEAFRNLVMGEFNKQVGHAPWDVYLRGADILEKA